MLHHRKVSRESSENAAITVHVSEPHKQKGSVHHHRKEREVAKGTDPHKHQGSHRKASREKEENKGTDSHKHQDSHRSQGEKGLERKRGH